MDEKPQIQALERTAPVLPMMPGVPERRSYDYVRHGTIDLFAALNIATGKVIGKLSAQHRAVDFRDFLDEIDRQTDSGLAIHVICDNLSAHKAPAVQQWLLAHPRVHAALHPDLLLLAQPGRAVVRRTAAALPGPRRVLLPRELTTALEDWIKIWNPTPGRSSGPRPPTRSSTASAATAHASPDRDTSMPRTSGRVVWRSPPLALGALAMIRKTGN